MQSSQINFVGSIVRQFNIETRNCFEQWIVFCAVHRKSEDGWVVREDHGRAISLMYIAVDDSRSLNQAIATQHANRDGDVVQNAKPFTAIRKSMMGAAGEVRADSFLKCRACRTNGATDCVEGSSNQTFTPGQTEPAQLSACQRAITET